MRPCDLSILIPARNEEFLVRTIQDILDNIEADTEVIAVLDGYWPNPGIPIHDRVTVLHLGEAVGQRAATNFAARLARGKYLMKVDAHCSFDKGFDRKMIDEMHDDWTMVPTMKNLHAFDWVCECGERKYQDKGGTCKCGKQMTKDIKWLAKKRPNSNSYCFDSTPHFQYFGEYNKRPEGKGDLTETMSLQGSCFMCTKDKYWELNLSDETLGNWGNQGIEVACKTWLSGGKCMVNHKTWYSHMFRTKQVNDFGFPWPISGKETQKTRNKVKALFWNNNNYKYPLSWLVERFWPVKGWDERSLEEIKTNQNNDNKKTT